MKQYLPKQPIKQVVNTNLASNYKVINENKNQFLAQQPQISQITNKNNIKQPEINNYIQPQSKVIQNNNKITSQQQQTSTTVSQNNRENTFSVNNVPTKSKADEKIDILQNNKNLANSVSKASSVQVQQKKMEKEEANQYDFSLSDYDSTEEKVSAPVKPIVQNTAQLKQQASGANTQSNNFSKQQEQKNVNVATKVETKKDDFGFDDLSDFDDDEEESKPAKAQESKYITKQTQQPAKIQKQEEEEEQEMYEEIYEDDFENTISNSANKFDYNSIDLNKLSVEELEKHKALMDKGFNKNQKKPGDKDFVYDKRETFEQNEENEWDEEM